MKHLALLLLLGCATSHEAHSEAKIEAANQEEVRLETHTEEGAWSVRTWQYRPSAGAGKTNLPALASSVAPAVPETGHPSFLGWPTEGEVISYSEEVHQPTVIDATQNAKANASLNADSLAESHKSFKLGLSLVTKLGIALGLALALWLAFKKGWAGLALAAIRR